MSSLDKITDTEKLTPEQAKEFTQLATGFAQAYINTILGRATDQYTSLIDVINAERAQIRAKWLAIEDGEREGTIEDEEIERYAEMTGIACLLQLVDNMNAVDSQKILKSILQHVAGNMGNVPNVFTILSSEQIHTLMKNAFDIVNRLILEVFGEDAAQYLINNFSERTRLTGLDGPYSLEVEDLLRTLGLNRV